MAQGILNLIKPYGATSFSLVAAVKRLTGIKHTGHAGTLDPLATGVLPVCLGQGTRIVEFLMDATKLYRAEIELGMATDTYDAAGRILYRGNPDGIGKEQMEIVLSSFRGTIQQVPPMYSALKHHGKPLYVLARSGISIARESRQVQILRLELLDYTAPVLTIEIECSKGTYIRSLAYDLGEQLGCGAYLKNLMRLRCGPFDIKEAVSLPELEEAVCCGYWERYLYPLDAVLLHLNAAVVGDETGEDIKNGRPLALKGNPALSPPESYCRAYATSGSFLGVLRYDASTGVWQPHKVFCR
ncbi:MAG: tRNA pseudouridine(55) synthase TruB [Chloroflexota bacterium]